MISSWGALGCLALKARHGQHFPMCSFTWAAKGGQKNWLYMRSSMHSRPRWPTWSWHPFRATSVCAAGNTSWRGSPLILWVWLICTGCPVWVLVCFIPTGTDWIWVDQLVWTVVYPGFHPAVWRWPDSEYDLLAEPDASPPRSYRWPAGCQTATVGIDGTCRAFKGSLLHILYCCSCDLEMSTWVVRHTSWTGHPQQGICIYVCLSSLVVQLEIVVCHTGCVQLGGCEDIS